MKKAEKNTKQEYLPLELGRGNFPHIALVIPKLIFSIILGADFLGEYKAQIDLENKICTLIDSNQTPNPVKFTSCWGKEDNRSIRVNTIENQINLANQTEEKIRSTEITPAEQNKMRILLWRHRDSFSDLPGKTSLY